MLVSPLFAEFVNRIKLGQIREEHLKALMENPDGILSQECQERIEKLIALLPKEFDFYLNSLTIADGRPLYLAKRDDGKEVVVWGGREFKAYDGCRGNEHFSSLSLADGFPLYNAKRGDKRLIVWGAREYREYENIVDLSFADGRPLYQALRDGKWSVVWGEQEFKAYDSIFELSFADGRPLYQALRDGKWSVVWGDREMKAYDDVFGISVADGQPLYHIFRDGQVFVVWGDREFKGYIQNSDDYDELMIADGAPLHNVVQGDKAFVVWGDREYKAYDLVCDLSFADGKPLYRAKLNHAWFVVWGDKEFPSNYRGFVYGPTVVEHEPFYTVGDEGDSEPPRVVWGEETLLVGYQSWSHPILADGKPLYTAHAERKTYVALGDRIISKGYDQILDLTFADGAIGFYGCRGRRLFRVTIKVA